MRDTHSDDRVFRVSGTLFQAGYPEWYLHKSYLTE